MSLTTTIPVSIYDPITHEHIRDVEAEVEYNFDPGEKPTRGPTYETSDPGYPASVTIESVIDEKDNNILPLVDREQLEATILEEILG